MKGDDKKKDMKDKKKNNNDCSIYWVNSHF